MALREVPQQCEEATGSNSDRKPGCPAGSRGGKHPVQKVLEAMHPVPSHRRSPPPGAPRVGVGWGAGTMATFLIRLPPRP